MKLEFQFYESVEQICEQLPPDEERHMRRVGILTGLFAQMLLQNGYPGLSPRDAILFGRAARYHDIGKIWVPREVLMKPGHLTEEERNVMLQHPVFGQMLFVQAKAGGLAGIPAELLEPAMDCGVYHHEWWNGRGYPYGIKETEIPLSARISAICDAYDAMTSDRVYRKAHTHEYACRELYKNAGTQFDPELVPVFVKSSITQAAVTRR